MAVLWFYFQFFLRKPLYVQIQSILFSLEKAELKYSVASGLRVDQVWSMFGSQCCTPKDLYLWWRSCLSQNQQGLTLWLLTVGKCVNTAWQGTILCQSVTVAAHSVDDHCCFLSFGEEMGVKSRKPGTTSTLTATAAVQTAKAVGLAEELEKSSRNKTLFCVYQSSSLFITELIQLTARKLRKW